MIYISGPGHGGPAVVANTYLESTNSEIYPNISQDEAGLKRLFTQFSFPGGIPSHAPGNGAPIGGLKVVTENGWFAARPSGTENIYKIYVESFRGEDHLRRIAEDAQAIVDAALADE